MSTGIDSVVAADSQSAYQTAADLLRDTAWTPTATPLRFRV